MSCLVCGHPELAHRFTAGDRLYGTTPKSFRVAACRRCGLLQLDPLPAAEELRAYYPDSYWFAPDRSTASRLEESYRRLVLRDHLAFVEHALRDSRASGPVLDYGCGGGLFLGMLAERGFPVLGMDFSPEAAAIAARRPGVAALCGSLEQVPLRDATCAAVTMFHVLEHVREPRAYLEAAGRLLAPNGRLIVQVPDAACWQFKLLGAAWTGIDVPRHLSDFRSSDLEALLVSAGFQVVRRKHFSLRDNPAGLASSLAPGLDPMARRIRRIPESGMAKLVKDLVYFAILMAGLPFAVAEAAFRAGSTIMIEARRL